VTDGRAGNHHDAVADGGLPAGTDGITAVQYGVGPIGARIVETAHARGVEFVGAIDVDPGKVGADLGEVAGRHAEVDGELGAVVTDDPDEALAAAPDVVYHSTASSLAAVGPQLERAIEAGADVVSTTEELSYPWRAASEAARVLDGRATEAGVTVLGTGINPGFAMDAFPAAVTTPCRSVGAVRVERVQDAAQRREPLQRKIGAGTDRATFEAEVAAEAGHVGLRESVAMLAAALGWELETVRESVEPVIADERVESPHLAVDAGEVAGVHQVGVGVVDGEERLELDLRMYLGAPEPRDRVEITGQPDLSVVVEGGFHGDVATPAVVANVTPRVRAADPGLATMLDLDLPSFAGP
jgi:4-hydroxy-tetrahydrodipicolinate reductase